MNTEITYPTPTNIDSLLLLCLVDVNLNLKTGRDFNVHYGICYHITRTLLKFVGNSAIISEEVFAKYPTPYDLKRELHELLSELFDELGLDDVYPVESQLDYAAPRVIYEGTRNKWNEHSHIGQLRRKLLADLITLLQARF